MRLRLNDVMEAGLEVLGFESHSHGTNKQRFESIFGAPPEIVLIIWRLIIDDLLKRASIFHLMMALCWLCTYKSENISAGRFNVTEKTYRKWSWIIIEKIANLYSNKVSHFPF